MTRLRPGLILCVSLLWMPASLAAAQNVNVNGTVTTGTAPVANAVVTLNGPANTYTTKTTADGKFGLTSVVPGVYHLEVTAGGFLPTRTDLTVAVSMPPLEVRINADPHFTEVISVSPDARSQFDTYQPTSVLAGQDLGKQLEMSLGGTLERQPGVATRAFGPATPRPVVRGLDGDRVLILQDGQRMADLSSQSADHAVTVNPAAAQRIEVVRGPATLLYGANAIGGLVNVITEDIPTAPVQGVTGNVIVDLGSAANEGGGAMAVRAGNGRVALHASGGGRRSDDVNTPEGEILNSQSRSGFGSAGVSWTGSRGYLGGSYGYDDTKLGIPIVEEGILQSTPRKHSMSVRAGAHGLTGVFESLRATLAVRRYKHEELEGDVVGTAFKNDTEEIEFMGNHRAFGRLKGSVGAWVFNRAFDAAGEEALSPPVDQGAFSAFLHEEVAWPHVTFQFAGRVDRTRYAPNGESDRTFTTGSGSAGLLFRPSAANHALTLAVSIARAARYPAVEELFYFGPHPGNFAFEIGNPGLEAEHALGLDVSLRWRLPRASGEVSYFRNDISNYLFRSPLTEEEFEAREPEFAARFPDRGIGEEEEGEEGHSEFPIIEYVAADSVLQGIEAHADFPVTARLSAEVGLDYVRGTLKASDEPLPRIPPLRFRGGLRYQHNAIQAGGEVTVAARQDRVFTGEEPTDGFGLLRLFAAYSFQTGRSVSTITARLDNATNELYRNHLSYIKAFAPEMGRNFKLLYNVTF